MIAYISESKPDTIVVNSLKKDARLSDSFKHDKGNIKSINFLNDEYYVMHRCDWVPDNIYGGKARKLSYTIVRNGAELLTFDEKLIPSSLFTSVLGKIVVKINDKEYDLQKICEEYIKGQTKEQIAESKINLQNAIIECAKLGVGQKEIEKLFKSVISMEDSIQVENALTLTKDSK